MRARVVGLFLVLFAMVAAWPKAAAAQVVVYPPIYPYPYPYPLSVSIPVPIYGGQTDVRLDVKPREAQVYVDGYYSGLVDDFDGVFQRLYLVPGNHDIVVYMKGYHSLHQQLYFGPNTSRKISAKLEPLPAGSPDESIPVPAPPPPDANGEFQQMPPPQPMPRGPGRYPPPTPPNHEPGTNAPADTGSGTVGSVAIAVQPGGSDIVIDGEHWSAPARPEERLIMQLAEGHHVIEIHKTGYGDTKTEVDVRPGETTQVNISLTPDR